MFENLSMNLKGLKQDGNELKVSHNIEFSVLMESSYEIAEIVLHQNVVSYFFTLKICFHRIFKPLVS